MITNEYLQKVLRAMRKAKNDAKELDKYLAEQAAISVALEGEEQFDSEMREVELESKLHAAKVKAMRLHWLAEVCSVTLTPDAVRIENILKEYSRCPAKFKMVNKELLVSLQNQI